ncbi:hypothetical protein EDC04DRAFT_2907341 [Pisolithus marmoratus]|nr:hypothetical protein EDC04DRAFT_2907341 [Pisolithus marmoratus]
MSQPIVALDNSPSLQTSALRHVEFRAMVEEINDLQKKLDGTENNDDQLALEEDITGRILWACHSGLRSTAIPRSPPDLNQVLNSILKDDKMYHLLDRVKFLDEICTIFNDALAELPTDDQAHLRRIMSDAEAGTSKYQLLQDERAREQRAPGATVAAASEEELRPELVTLTLLGLPGRAGSAIPLPPDSDTVSIAGSVSIVPRARGLVLFVE